MAIEFKLPELGEGVESADVSRIYISEGDRIEADQNIMELETEKAVAELPCPHAGKITEIHVAEGDTIHVGQTLVTLEEVASRKGEPTEEPEPETSSSKLRERRGRARQTDEGETKDSDHGAETAIEEEPSDTAERRRDEDEEQAEEDDQIRREDGAQPQRRSSHGPGRHVPEQPPTPAGPATRRLARKLEVDLTELQPSGGGRIRQEDVVRAYVEDHKAAQLTGQPLPDFTQFGDVQREPLNAVARTAAQRLAAAWRAIPHVTQHGWADITDLESARRRHVEQTGDTSPKITLTSIALKTVAGLLKEFPKFNASLDVEQNELIIKHYYHLGVAVDTDQGLMVPVIRDVDGKSIEQIAADLHDVADRARNHRLGKDDFEGGTFTVSNQGGIGGSLFTPIVNYPEVAILGMARARPELRMLDGHPTERLILPLSLSYDHRAVNGADAARFIDRLVTVLANEFALLIAT